jgi:hypothetical protein
MPCLNGFLQDVYSDSLRTVSVTLRRHDPSSPILPIVERLEFTKFSQRITLLYSTAPLLPIKITIC